MEGVTTAIVAFLFAGVIWPHLIKNRVQFYASLIIVAFIIVLDGIARGFAGPGGMKAIYAINALLQVSCIVLLVLSAGMTVRDLGGEVMHTIDVVRRGGEKETIIVPLKGQQPKSRDRDEPVQGARVSLDRDIAAEEAALDAAELPRPVVPPPPANKPESSASIPLEP